MSKRLRTRAGWPSLAFAILSLLSTGCGAKSIADPDTDLDASPSAGNADGGCTVPSEAEAEDASNPDIVVGDGTPESCTSAAFVQAVADGGIITFNCGDAGVTIKLDATAKVVNTSAKVVIDGANKITLSGQGARRILYQNTCDSAQIWTTSHCDNQATPKLTVQNLTFIDGNSSTESDGEGGGAIFAEGGRLKVVNSRFFNNTCPLSGPDVGGGAIRAFMQFDGGAVYVVNSTFGGSTALGNVGSNGGALSSIGVSWSIINSQFSYNRAVGYGANPAQSGTDGGGSGGAIYNDGNTFTLDLCGTTMANNTANEGGGAIFFVSNDLTGSLTIEDSTLTSNTSGEFETYPGIFVLAKDGGVTFTDSTISE